MKFEINKETKFRNAKHNEITLDSLTDKIISFIDEANEFLQQCLYRGRSKNRRKD